MMKDVTILTFDEVERIKCDMGIAQRSHLLRRIKGVQNEIHRFCCF